VIADTVGSELVLNPQPDLSGLGYDDAEKTAFVKLLKAWWKRWSWNPRECDLRGKLTVPQMIDVALRWDMAFGEVTGVMSYMGPAQRRQYGVKTGTKVCMIPPSRLVQDTSEFEGMFQGVIHDALGRPVAYRFREKADGIVETKDYRAFDGDGRPQVIHIFDPMDATDVRGISRMAAGFRKHIQHEILVDTTIHPADDLRRDSHVGQPERRSLRGDRDAAGRREDRDDERVHGLFRRRHGAGAGRPDHRLG
jgi:capsid protein